MENFIPYELAVKLKEKGFTCEHPFAMYDAVGIFYALYTSAGSIECYDYRDFDEHDYIAPTISQVLRWLREEKKIHIAIDLWLSGYAAMIYTGISKENNNFNWKNFYNDQDKYETNELAALAGIEYVIDNLI